MVGVFKEDVFEDSLYEIDWLIDADQDEPVNYALILYVSKIDKDRLERWRSNPQKQWRIEAEKQSGISRLSAHLAAVLDDKKELLGCGEIETFREYADYVKSYFRCAADLSDFATVEEIAEAVAILGDVLDISVPERQAAFIIQRFKETGLPTPAVWRICRHIACKEKGRALKPATFEPYFETARQRIGDFRMALSLFVRLYKSFDEALAYCLEKEPSLNFDAKQGEGERTEAKLTFDADLNSGKTGG